MQRIERTRDLQYDSNGVMMAVVDGQVSEASDLPALDGLFCGVKVQAGSIMQIVQTGDFVTLDENGSWYSADGSGAAATPERSTRGLTKAAQPTGISNSLLDIEPQIAEYVEEKEPVDVKDGGERR